MNFRLPAFLQIYGDRVDAMTLRERVLIFAAAVVVIVGWTFNIVLKPLIAERAGKTDQVQIMQDEMRTWDVQIEALARAKATGIRANDGQGSEDPLRQRVLELDRQFDERRAQIVQPDRMRVLLEEVVRRNGSLQLISITTLPPLAVTGVPGPTGGGVYRYGIELTVSGAYGDIVAYLASLERLPARVFWGGLDLTAAYPVTTIKLSLFTFGTEKTWLAL